jgi:hypothetical protein
VESGEWRVESGEWRVQLQHVSSTQDRGASHNYSTLIWFNLKPAIHARLGGTRTGSAFTCPDEREAVLVAASGTTSACQLEWSSRLVVGDHYKQTYTQHTQHTHNQANKQLQTKKQTNEQVKQVKQIKQVKHTSTQTVKHTNTQTHKHTKQ